MLALPDVTLVAASSVALEATIKALEVSSAHIAFGEVLLLSDKAPNLAETSAISWRQIEPMRSRADYSRFMLGDLALHIGTRFALVVQWDGYILDPSKWNDAFLHYDYIGAPWPHFDDDHTVGNGGFSLRSRKLLQACRNIPQGELANEDIMICRTHRTFLEAKFDLRFAPASLAQEFSFERTQRTGREFGFHGVFNMFHDFNDRDFAKLLSSLEPGLLGKLESNELLRLAVRHRKPATFLQAIRQRIH